MPGDWKHPTMREVRSTGHLHFSRFAREAWKRACREPRRLPFCVDPCLDVPLLYTPLGGRLDARAITCAIERKDRRPKYLTLEDTLARTFVGGPG